jgi:hypothetical protein
MTIGVGLYNPQGIFAFPRSYIQKIGFDAVFFPMLHGMPNFVFQPSESPEINLHVTIFDRFVPWSSNSYTLDHIITEAWYNYHPDMTEIPYPFRLVYVPAIDSTGSGLYFRKQGSFSSPVWFDLPPRDQPYWLPDL